ncbi:hypothetical protein [Sphingomonas jatrophae]|nr:hypothetical protein [Sphingomonas jatrophae]
MSISETYRANAAEQRALAAGTSLANRKAMHERSAETWDAMALSAEQNAALTAANAAAKVGV